MEWSLKYANAGIAAAQHEVGYYYFNEVCGWGDFPKNNEEMEILYEAIKWFEKAGSQDYIESFKSLESAYNKLAYMYEMGYVVKQDFIKTHECDRKAAEQGCADAQNRLGNMFFKGEGVKQNYIEAINWYLKAADKGVLNAMRQLGLIYEKGYGVIADKEQANEWYRRVSYEKKNKFNLYALIESVEEKVAKEYSAGSRF